MGTKEGRPRRVWTVLEKLLQRTVPIKHIKEDGEHVCTSSLNFSQAFMLLPSPQLLSGLIEPTRGHSCQGNAKR
ncbi:hypothetical protein AOLI_G00141960 [Acnodon oligacanthus]